MLKHEDNLQIPPQSAAEVRVTPEELAAAITALQIRKEGQPGTIAIGDAVEELALDVTPEEVLAEVQARQRSVNRRFSLTSRKRKWLAFLSLSVLCLTGFGLYSATGTTSFDYSRLTPGELPYKLEPQILVINPVSPKPIISTLAEAPEGKTLYCSADAVYAASHSREYQEEPQRQIIQSDADMNWPVVKHGKDLYVRGWIRRPLSKAAAKLSALEVYNKSEMLTNPQPVTLRLDGLAGLGYQRLNQEGDGVFIFQAPRLNGRAYEKW